MYYLSYLYYPRCVTEVACAFVRNILKQTRILNRAAQASEMCSPGTGTRQIRNDLIDGHPRGVHTLPSELGVSHQDNCRYFKKLSVVDLFLFSG